MKIKNLEAYEIFNSRGLPTIECKITLENNKHVTASVPSGASTGSKEVVEKEIMIIVSLVKVFKTLLIISTKQLLHYLLIKK